MLWTPEASHSVSTDFERLHRGERGKGQAPLIHLPVDCRRAASVGPREKSHTVFLIFFPSVLWNKDSTETPRRPDTAEQRSRRLLVSVQTRYLTSARSPALAVPKNSS